MIKPSRHRLRILQRVAGGDAYKKIALDMGVSPSSIKNHMWLIRKGIDAKSSAHAVAIAIRKGWIK